MIESRGKSEETRRRVQDKREGGSWEKTGGAREGKMEEETGKEECRTSEERGQERKE